MPLTANHASTAAGLNLYFGNDCIDGEPIGPVHLVNGQTFYTDAQASNFQSRYLAAHPALFSAGVGTIAPAPGTQTASFRQGSGIPFQASE